MHLGGVGGSRRAGAVDDVSFSPGVGTMLLVTESGTRVVWSRCTTSLLALLVSSLMFLRKISPVEIAGIFSASSLILTGLGTAPYHREGRR